MQRTTIALMAVVALAVGFGTADAHHGRGSHGSGGSADGYGDDERRHGPPPWAPAHGWRAKHGDGDASRTKWRTRDDDDDSWRAREPRRWRRADDGGWWHRHEPRDGRADWWHWHAQRNVRAGAVSNPGAEDRSTWNDRFADWFRGR